ncbi:MAG: glycosyltransferase [Hyphomicrobiaceae bacterium]|nr:glycosyltransferase [Hyphomicrobiaceae bacterium]
MSRPAPPVLEIPDTFATPSALAKWTVEVQLQILLYIGVCVLAIASLPNTIWSPEAREFVYIIGILGIWRYLWWANHWMRAIVFGTLTYPKMRDRAAALWQSGWRPRHIHIQMTTFREHREISEAVIRALVREIREAGVPATLWLGSSESEDERRIADHLGLVGDDCDITLRIVRQNQPGKRVAIALILRAMSRAGLSRDDLVVFMDGDFVLHPGALRKCLPLFALDPQLHALTTDEYVLVKGPRWMQSWLDMRFSQRRLAMQSHALSNRVLTLTGRFSVFRAEHIVSKEFIRLQEADFLEHWLWGTFRFLSGDDKSTWYCLLRHGVKMTYVPDAAGTTIEVVDGSGYQRMVENLRRWSGNMLRNGQRAIMLGPSRMPFFIWWCCVDQRLAMWTMLFSPMLAIAGTVKLGVDFLIAYIIFIAVTRLLLSIVLFLYAPRVDLGYVWSLYANQLLNAMVKVYMLWRLSKQKWANRGNQKQGFAGNGWAETAREVMAAYLTIVSFSGLFLVVMIYTQLLETPSWGFVTSMFSF